MSGLTEQSNVGDLGEAVVLNWSASDVSTSPGQYHLPCQMVRS